MTARSLVNGLLSVATVIYPFAVYFGSEYLSVRGFVVVLFLLFCCRILLVAAHASIRETSIQVVVLGFFAVFVYTQNSEIGLRFYPVLINSGLFLMFFYSLLYPPSVIEKLARLSEPNLPASGVSYTRKVTMVWCCFFILNGSIAAYTAVFSSLEIWSLYNGLVAYLLIGCLFALEYGVRRLIRRRESV